MNALKNYFSVLFVTGDRLVGLMIPDKAAAFVCCIDEDTHERVVNVCIRKELEMQALDLTQHPHPEGRIVDASEWLDVWE